MRRGGGVRGITRCDFSVIRERCEYPMSHRLLALQQQKTPAALGDRGF
jgi:hypothetical protein